MTDFGGSDEQDVEYQAVCGSERRNREALRYLHHCGFMRTEPNKHKLEAILLGREYPVVPVSRNQKGK